MMHDSGSIASTRSEASLCTTLHGCTCKERPSAKHIALSLDTDILDALHATGEDWEAYFNAILREWLRSNLPVPMTA
ncbi:MAG: BrnA antitoxin family protein [Betaproteobacteria bacterium]|jgi:uncharacterized protein (DUF4415 family)|nr:BrnA antitoxin family protein [Betaproteobacteria bacterium]